MFLCKIVDETQNPDELKFYWRGIAYDDYFDLQDRLQKLYQIGMKRFLGEDVTYIDESSINQAFRFFINDPDATRKTIQKYFRELKFFTNNDFAFIDVHNEKLFYQNAEVLLKIVQMLQGIHLKTDEQNQFLGDMFEGFLDQGIKQSEGQFFTPMPIVKFILASLPLESIIKNNEQVPKVVDYACGAGHFLNEYALQIVPYVAKHKEIDIAEYYPEVIGIEKEYRLSKVAKVSAFMYGQDDIKIIYDDALSTNPNIKDGNFSVLISNPPYSVKGFLETLEEPDRNKFEMMDAIDKKSLANNNSIETFFVERTKQLLKPDGVAGIIVPSSILSKGSSKNTSKKQNLYVATREIILRYFDIVAIAEFGSGTFGKTGTNTVTLFLKRKKEDPAPADHYRNRVEAWFKNDTSKNGIFADENLIKKYCDHLEYRFDDYKTLLEGTPNEKILTADVFKEYRQDFNKWSEIKNRKKQRTFKALSKEEQKSELDKRFLEYLRNVESDKLYYFVLASLNPTEVIIVQTPNDTKSKKKFLGYEWSSAKGNEGIQYFGDVSIIENNTDTILEEEAARALSNILNLDNIQTPLYNPKNFEDTEKINSIISANFDGKPIVISDELKEYATTAKLVDMLDFSRKEFNKSISLTPKRTITIDTTWDLVKLKDITEIIAGQSPKSSNYNEDGRGLPFYQGKKDFGVLSLNKPIVWTTETTKESLKGDLLMSVRAPVGAVNFNPYEKICIGRGLAAIRSKDNDLLKYLFELIISHQYLFTGYHGATFESISTTDLGDIKIPLPPAEVQKSIVQACKAIDKEFENATKSIQTAKDLIENKINAIYDSNSTFLEIGAISTFVQYGINEKMNTNGRGYKIFRMNEIINKQMYDGGEMKYADISETEFIKYKLEKGDILFNRTNSIEHVGKTGIFLLEGDYCFASYLIRVQIDESIALPYFVNLMMNSSAFQQEAKAVATKAINQSNINATKMKNIKIPVPSIAKQKAFIKTIINLENKIAKEQSVVDNITIEKQKVVEKYL